MKLRTDRLETVNARRKLALRKLPYYRTIAPGLALAYRRNEGAGTWAVRWTTGTVRKMQRLALADDFAPADGAAIMTYFQAHAAAIAAVPPSGSTPPGGDPTKAKGPLTVGQAIDRYQENLKAVGGDVYNAVRLRKHAAELLATPVAMLSHDDLNAWRNSLAERAKGTTVNRVLKVLRSALSLAAKSNRKVVRNEAAWKDLRPVDDGDKPREGVFLTQPVVLELVAAAHARDRGVGLLADVMSQTGCRPSQLARLLVRDFDRVNAMLRMPRSGKGNARRRVAKMREHVWVPIPASIVALLTDEARGRGAIEPLLRRTDGSAWDYKRMNPQYRYQWTDVVVSVGLDPEKITMYALRHSFITRALVVGCAISSVAKQTDTSEREIRSHYTGALSQESDAVMRRAFLEPLDETRRAA